MSALDVIVIVVALVAAGYGASVYWRRSREESAPEPAPAGGGGVTPPKKDPPLEKPAPPDEPKPRSERKLEAQRPAPPEPVPQVVPKLYKEEEDESLDPTRVGSFEAPSEDDSEETDGEGNVGPAPVHRILHDEDADGDEPSRVQGFFLVYAMAQTDKGLRRENNEDSMLVLEKASLFAVADGMGGHRGGEHASQLAVTTIEQAFTTNAFEGPAYEELPKQASELARAIDMANRAIHGEAKKNRKLEGMGTTLCAARFAPNKNRLFIGHVGDSRCYRLRGGVLQQMTTDHTMADLGIKGPEGSHLSRALGPFAVVPIDVVVARPAVNDVYLICSDGLTKMLSDEAIANVLRHESDLKAAVERLILFANGHGGKDNITVILVRVEPPPAQRKMKQTLVGVG
jgi:protein phosphatase